MSAVLLADEGGHPIVNELPIPPFMFGVVTLLVFLALLAFLWSFRNTLQVDASEHHGHGDGHGDEHGESTDVATAGQKH